MFDRSEYNLSWTKRTWGGKSRIFTREEGFHFPDQGSRAPSFPVGEGYTVTVNFISPLSTGDMDCDSRRNQLEASLALAKQAPG